MNSTTMPRFIGTKIIMAASMTRLAYNQYRGWELPADENGADEGFLVEYLDGGESNVPGHQGYVSWSPAKVFEQSYRPAGSGLTFSEALEAIKIGKSVRRAGWNGANQFVYKVAGDRIASALGYGFGEHIGEPSTADTLVLRNAQNRLVCGWVPSMGDLFAEDWEVLP